jgi:hypothetical protein
VKNEIATICFQHLAEMDGASDLYDWMWSTTFSMFCKVWRGKNNHCKKVKLNKIVVLKGTVCITSN